MSIQNILNEIIPYNAKISYAEFNNIMDNSYIELSFLGKRTVYAIGYSGSIDLQSLCEKVTGLVDSNPEFSEEERSIGVYIERKIEKLYKVSESQIEKANIITKFFINYYPVICNPSYSDFFAFGVGMYTCFNYYTSQQYKNVTGKYPEGDEAGSFCKQKYGAKVKVWDIREVDEN